MSKQYKIKPVDGKLKIDLPADNYLIQQEDRDGVIVVTCTPSDQLKLEFESELNGIIGEIAILEGQKDELTAKIQALKQQKKDVENIIAGL